MTETQKNCSTLEKTIEQQKKELQELYEQIENLYNQPQMTEKMVALAKEWRESGRLYTPPISYVFPNSYLSIKAKYWPIRNVFIVPFNKLIDKILEKQKLITENERVVFALKKEMTEEDIENYRKIVNTKTKVVIDYDIDPGDCGDCY